jgi:putative oxidoreductase
MQRDKLIYIISTGLLGASMIYTASTYLFNDEAKASFDRLGLPGYFRIELAIAKILGALVLMGPAVAVRLKEFAYDGFAITFISAFIAHLAVGDPLTVLLKSVFTFALLTVSWVWFRKNSGRPLFKRTTA